MAQGGEAVSSAKQRDAAHRNVRKAAAGARAKRTIAHLPKAIRAALAKKAASVRKRKTQH
jgi:ribosomal protein S7